MFPLFMVTLHSQSPLVAPRKSEMSFDHVQIVYTSFLKSLRTGLENSNFFKIQMGTNGDFWGLMGTKFLGDYR